ncbi:MAG TPA: methyl-accepting chemotaxis protein [Rhodanobacteraceae bacterium]|nr:methyl-accepting chemotaxis protein [Rhodanobacteraceae bacterium]
MKWTIGLKIGAGYALAIVVLVVIGIVAYQSTRGYTDATERRAHTAQVLDSLNSVLASMRDAEAGERGYLVLGDQSYLQPYHAASRAADKALESLRSLTAADAAQQARVEALASLVAAKQATLERAVTVRRDQGLEAAQALMRTGKGQDVMDRMRDQINTMRDAANVRLRQRDAAVDAQGAATIASIVYGIPAALVLLVLAGWLFTRSVTRNLRESMAQLASSAAEILATTSQVAAGAAETATAVNETTATVEEVKQTAQLSSQKARHVSDSAQRASSVSEAGRKSADDAVEGMHQIRQQMESIGESIMRLSEHSQAIGEIIATVGGLAEQSNLLAVNAAIEASRAGEQGKGFGVVAQEIRSLAEQSRQATTQVRGILGDIQKATSGAVLAMEQGTKAVQAGVTQTSDTGEAIRALTESIGEAAQAASQIAASSHQQMVGMDQVASAMESIKQASAQNVAGTRQAETAAEGLHELGKRLGRMIGTGRD